MNASNINSVYLHSDLDLMQRNNIIHSFRNDETINCLLCNSKIGGEGLTLTEANEMIFFKWMVEPFF